MLVLMCGLPSSGKSTIVDLIVKGSRSSIWVIRPEDWLPEGLAEMGPEEEKNYRIECWRTALAEAEGAVEKHDSADIIILDCGNSKFKPLHGLLQIAKRNGHKRVVLYVNSRPAQCKERAGDSWVGQEVAKSYIENIRDSLPKFKSKCDQILIVENMGILEDLEQNALTVWSRLCPIT